MPKNIVVLSDGTGQDGGKGHDSNVYKLFRMLEDRTENQIVYYDEGLGTETQKLSGMAFGAGIDKNILQCYRFIFDHYQAGDKIFLFGFSRGAATVRSLASFIHYFGMLPVSRPELIEQAYKIYTKRKVSYHQSPSSSNPSDSTFKALNTIVHQMNDTLRDDLDKPGGKSFEFVRKHPNMWVKIEFLGVWDTVPALGLASLPGLDALLDRVPAWKHLYHNFKLRGSVKHACHALSIDDNRKPFFPSIWKEYDPILTEKVEQVWFGGSHTDVGGGFWEAGFSDIALEWMVQKAFEHGLRFYFDSRDGWNFYIAPDATDLFHNPRSSLGVLYPSGMRDTVWDNLAFRFFGPPRVHESVLERARHFPHKQKQSDEKPSIWKKAWSFFQQKPETEEESGYWPWILDKYPRDVEKLEWYETHYKEVWAPSKYQRWAKKELKKPNGKRALPPLNEWMSQPENSFGKWMADQFAFEEFNDKEVKFKVLVEKTKTVVFNPDGDPLVLRRADLSDLPHELAKKALVLRDYDRDDLLNILRDESAYKILRDRVKKIDKSVIAKAGRSKKNELMSEPKNKPYLYRIDWDKKRWNINR